jgi:hypothetical protein
VYTYTIEGGELAWLITLGEEVNTSRIEFPLPNFLVWGEKWQDLPEEHYFVGPESVLEQGGGGAADW